MVPSHGVLEAMMHPPKKCHLSFNGLGLRLRFGDRGDNNVGLNFDLILSLAEFFSVLGAHQMCSI